LEFRVHFIKEINDEEIYNLSYYNFMSYLINLNNFGACGNEYNKKFIILMEELYVSKNCSSKKFDY
jgi:hypothetical protein